MTSATVIVCSTRAATGVYPDRTGPVIAAWLGALGIPADVVVVADGDPVGIALDAALAAGSRVILTTGGTGPSPTDATPEQTLPRLARQLPGIAEELRRRGTASTPLALLSRGVAGLAANGAVIVNLPGSIGGVTDGLAVLDDLLPHLLDQVGGRDHARDSASGAGTADVAGADG